MMGTGTPCPVGLVSNISVLSSMYLPSTLARPQSQDDLFICLFIIIDSPPAFGSVSVETIQETSEIELEPRQIDGRISQSINNG